MPNPNQFDPRTFDYGALSPADWNALKSRLIDQAHHERSEAIRALWARALAQLRQWEATVVAALVRKWRSYRSARGRRLAIAQLHALDDRELRDIGLRRCEIESVVNGRGRDVSRRVR